MELEEQRNSKRNLSSVPRENMPLDCRVLCSMGVLPSRRRPGRSGSGSMRPQQPLQDAARMMRGPGGSAAARRPEPKDILLQTPEPSSSCSTYLRLVSAGFSCGFRSEEERLTGMERSKRKGNSPPHHFPPRPGDRWLAEGVRGPGNPLEVYVDSMCVCRCAFFCLSV